MSDSDAITGIDTAMVQSSAPPRYYFGYGSNLWLQQMNKRCPESKYHSFGVIRGWKWIINSRHVANIIPSENTRDEVYGLIYEISTTDEKKLDLDEGVSKGSYIKCSLPVKSFGPRAGLIAALVYVDMRHQLHSFPRVEYIQRINFGIEDGIEKGIPMEHFEISIRPFVPAPRPQIIAPIAVDAVHLVADLPDGISTKNIECRKLCFSENQKWIIQFLPKRQDDRRECYIRSQLLSANKNRQYINKSESDNIGLKSKPMGWFVTPGNCGHLIATDSEAAGGAKYWTFNAGSGKIELRTRDEQSSQIWGIGDV
ncbi:hypothetical protein BYT27DRAFT_7202878 [Phlegmacium glaucopus]|nr:hypothetical protein BYT27DRAFT_7202878 [Phlegmacium glaucopus]